MVNNRVAERTVPWWLPQAVATADRLEAVAAEKEGRHG